MKKFLMLLAVVLLAASPLYAQFLPDNVDSNDDRTGFVPFVATVAQLPASATANKGWIAVVTDAASATDCYDGGGSTVNTCVSIGTNWVNVA